MNIIAIDPGPERSGFIFATWAAVGIRPFPDEPETIGTFLPVIDYVDGSMKNDDVRLRIVDASALTHICCETMNNIGGKPGAETFETCYWIGEFRGMAKQQRRPWAPIEQGDVKKHVIGTRSGKPSLVRKELIKRWAFGETDEKLAKRIAMGTATKPGPLFGVTDHAWMALAVMVTYIDKKQEERNALSTGKKETDLASPAEGDRRG